MKRRLDPIQIRGSFSGRKEVLLWRCGCVSVSEWRSDIIVLLCLFYTVRTTMHWWKRFRTHRLLAFWPFRSAAGQQLLRELIKTWHKAPHCLLVFLSNSTRCEGITPFTSLKSAGFHIQEPVPADQREEAMWVLRFDIYTPGKWAEERVLGVFCRRVT